MTTIVLQVNGSELRTDGAGETSLLDVVRRELQLTGAKNGCGTGACGTCTVLLDGKPVNACSLPISRAMGKKVTTIEGLADDELACRIKEAFVTVSAPQCGFCSPAMVLRAYALVKKTPVPSRNEIVTALTPVLCRCTGYHQYVSAVLLATGQVNEDDINSDMVFKDSAVPLEPADRDCRVIGESGKRRDNEAFVDGTARFSDDFTPEGLLFGSVVTCPAARARILSIDPAEALDIPGVVAVLTADDIPGRNSYGKIIRDREALCRTETRCCADPVALVLAETEATAREAAAMVHVEYKNLPALLSAQEALNDDAPQVHKSGNEIAAMGIRKGSEDCFDGSYPVLTGEYSTDRVDQCPLEPACSLAWIDENDVLTVIAPTQNVFFDRLNIARVLKRKAEQVRVIQPAVGGAFGKREDIHGQILAALGSVVTGKPVKIRYTRDEAFRWTTKRHPFFMTIKTAYDEETGLLMGQKVSLLADGGAYASWSKNILRKALVHCCGPYDIPNVRVDAKAVYTNNPVSGAMRGFGAPQVAFAMETHLDRLAMKLNLDPFELRHRNMLRQGSSTITGHRITSAIPALDTLEAAREAAVSTPPAKLEESGNNEELTGRGMASIFYGIGFGAGIKDVGKAMLKLEQDGTFSLKTGAVDYGQGANTIFCQIAAEVLGISQDLIKIFAADTHITPNSGSTVASRQTYITGNAVLAAAAELKDKITGMLSAVLNVPAESLYLDGEDVVSPTNLTRIDLKEVFTNALQRRLELLGVGEFRGHQFTGKLDPDTGQGDAYWPYTFGTQIADVAVNKSTGKVRVTNMIAVHYIGRALNPQQVKGQVLGAMAMGLGYALSEHIPIRNGEVATTRLNDYRIVRTRDMPPVSIVLLEGAEFQGPYHAVGIGEPPLVPTAPAITNAIFDATGLRISSLPVMPEKILNHLNKHSKDNTNG